MIAADRIPEEEKTMSPRFSALAATISLSPVQSHRRLASPPLLRLMTPTNSAAGPPSPRLRASRRRVPLVPFLPVAYRGSYLRRLLAPRRPVERALLSVIQQTYLAGASTRTIDALAETVGVPGTDPAVVEAQASDWDLRVEVFRTRPLREPYPYLLLVETPALVREAPQTQTCSIVVAVAIAESGDRDVVGIAIRPADSLATFWEIFLNDLKERGLRGLRLVTSDRLPGMLPALAATFSGVPWQRCREGFIAQTLRTVPQRGRAAVEAGLRAAFAERDAATALEAFDRLGGEFRFTCPELAAALVAPVGAPLTYYQAAPAHRHLVSSLSGLASMQRELRQSVQLVGIFPHRQALLRLAGTILQEISDEWAARPQRLRRRAKAGAVVWAESASGRVASASAAALASPLAA
jgi:transposase-like protein